MVNAPERRGSRSRARPWILRLNGAGAVPPEAVMKLPFQDRSEAGRLLGQALDAYARRPEAIILALPRGGVPVGFEVARKLEIPLDLMLVRKLGTPGNEDLAMGAIASGGVSVLNKDLVSACWISDEIIEAVAVKERRTLELHEQLYRGNRPVPEVKGRCVIVVDDGIATGATMRAGVAGLRQRMPARIVAAAPVASPDTVERLRKEADEVVCLATPEPFFSIGRWYRDFPEITDAEVREFLAQAWNKASRA
jgi:putative phosphoribosyl transferase